MATVTDEMRSILTDDATIMGILPGGILDEPITGATDAVWGTPDAITGVRPFLATGVLLDPEEVDAVGGLNPGRRLDSDLWPELYLYADHDDLDTLDDADARAMVLLHERRIGLADIEATGFRARPLESDELPGTIWHIFRRYRVRLVRHIAEV